MNKHFAVIQKGIFLVENTIVAPDGFNIPGAYLVEVTPENPAQPGAYYNPGDGHFYGDPEYNTDYKKSIITD